MDRIEPSGCLETVLRALWHRRRDTTFAQAVSEVAGFVDALLACALVSRAWREVAQPLLSQHVVVRRSRLAAISARFGVTDAIPERLAINWHRPVVPEAPIADDAEARRIRVVAVESDRTFLHRLLEASIVPAVVIVPSATWYSIHYEAPAQPLGRPTRLRLDAGTAPLLLHADVVHMDRWSEPSEDDESAAPSALSQLRDLRIDASHAPSHPVLRRHLHMASELHTLELGKGFAIDQIIALGIDHLPRLSTFTVGLSTTPIVNAFLLRRLVDRLPATLTRLVVRGTGPNASSMLGALAGRLEASPEHLPMLRAVEVDIYATSPAVLTSRGIAFTAGPSHRSSPSYYAPVAELAGRDDALDMSARPARLPPECLRMIVAALWHDAPAPSWKEAAVEIEHFVDALLVCAVTSRQLHGIAQPLIDTHVIMTSNSASKVRLRFGLDVGNSEVSWLTSIPVDSDAKRIRVMAVLYDDGLLEGLVEHGNALEVVVARSIPRDATGLSLIHVALGNRYHLPAAATVRIDRWFDTAAEAALSSRGLPDLRDLRIDASWSGMALEMSQAVGRASHMHTLELGSRLARLDHLVTIMYTFLSLRKLIIPVCTRHEDNTLWLGRLMGRLPAMLVHLVMRGTSEPAPELIDALAEQLNERPTYLQYLRLVEVDIEATAPDVFIERGIGFVAGPPSSVRA